MSENIDIFSSYSGDGVSVFAFLCFMFRIFSEAADAIKNDSMQFYGLKMKRIVECPQYSQFDTSMYSYMNSSEITKILQGFSSDPEDELVSPIADVEQEQLIEQGHDLCAFCGGYCLPNDCLTEAWIERHSKT